jgi:predicted nuclease of predicted toxin-antitoxin system
MFGCIVDEHISHALVHALRLAGINTLTVQDCGFAGADDEQIAAVALREQRLVLTNDADFLREAALAPQKCPPIIYWPRHAKRKIRQLVTTASALTNQSDYQQLCSRVFYA